MGYYINQDSKGNVLNLKKAQALVADGATVIDEPKVWEEGIVCVIDNGMFEAAGYAYNESEMNVFKEPDGRRKTWLIHPKAKELAK